MAIKFDKDALIKHRFWILLGVFALLWIVGLSVLWANAGSPADAAKKNYDDADKAAQGAQNPKNDSYLPPWNDYGKVFKDHKNEIWNIAFYGDKPGTTLPEGQKPWKGQEGMYTWPTTENPQTGEKGEHPLNSLLRYPDSPFDQSQREWYRGTEDNHVYLRQFFDLYNELKSPPDFKPGATDPPGLRPLDPVQFKSSDPNDYWALMKPVNFEGSTKPPDVEECWLAQEDFWVRREVLYVLRDALQAAERMTPVDDQVKTPLDTTKYTARHVFRNDSWEVTLLFDKGENNGPRVSPDSTIKNVHVSHRDQELGTAQTPSGVWFRLRLGNDGPFYVGFDGESVPWGQEHVMSKGNKYPKGFPAGGNPAGSAELEQVFDVSDTPVTRVDEIAIPKVSHHNANIALVPAKPQRFGKKEEKPAADAKTPTAMPGGAAGGVTSPTPGATGGAGSPPMGSPQGSPGPSLPGQPGGQQSGGDMTANKFFDRDRYLYVTDQSRHLPVAVTLTVDQSHLSDLLVAFANSKLRFQTTQVEFRRVPSAAPASAPNGTGMPEFGPGPSPGGTTTSPMPMTGGTGRPLGPLAPRVGSGSPAGPPGGIMTPPTFPGTPNGGQTSAAAAPAPDNPNLIEVTVYGIASLYERPR